MSDPRPPTFLIPGVSRAGTTTLHDYLSEHSDIFMPAEKELRFFDRDENYNRGVEYYEKPLGKLRRRTGTGASRSTRTAITSSTPTTTHPHVSTKHTLT